MSKKLIRNAIKCNKCGDIIESTYTHCFKWCSCHTVFVDGGLDYARRGFVNSTDDYTELSEWSDEEDEEECPGEEDDGEW